MSGFEYRFLSADAHMCSVEQAVVTYTHIQTNFQTNDLIYFGILWTPFKQIQTPIKNAASIHFHYQSCII